MVHFIYLGVLGYNFPKILHFLSEDLFTLSNSLDPDEMPQKETVFNLGLRCLPKYLFRGFQCTKSP